MNSLSGLEREYTNFGASNGCTSRRRKRRRRRSLCVCNLETSISASCLFPAGLKTLNRLAGIITQPVRLILQSKLPRPKPAADCEMDSPAEENMLSDSRPLPLSPLIYSCRLRRGSVKPRARRTRSQGHEIFTPTINSPRTEQRRRRKTRRSPEKRDPVLPGSLKAQNNSPSH